MSEAQEPGAEAPRATIALPMRARAEDGGLVVTVGTDAEALLTLPDGSQRWGWVSGAQLEAPRHAEDPDLSVSVTFPFRARPVPMQTAQPEAPADNEPLTPEDRAALTPSAAEAAVRRLVAVAQAMAECPCCGGTAACEPDCTYAEDSGGPQTEGPQRMAEARAALKPFARGGAGREWRGGPERVRGAHPWAVDG